MVAANRRAVLSGIALGAGLFPAAIAKATEGDGSAAGYEVHGASEFVSTIPRKGGNPVVFTASLDAAPIKATSGGWAREITARTLPLATGIAGAHLYINAGGCREMHWHNSNEWAYVVDGQCQATIVDAAGATEVANFGPGDLWYFPKGQAHAIQTLGDKACPASLAFDDGLYGEHGTFGLSDLLSRYDSQTLARAFGGASAFYDELPKGETYIEQGAPLALDGPQARAVRSFDPARTHRYALLQQAPRTRSEAGEFYVASRSEFPACAEMTGSLLRLRPGALQAPHWHSLANEWHYVLKGQARFTLFAPDKRLASAGLGPGQCAYIPRNCAHSIENTGDGDVEVLGVMDNAAYQESTLTDWLASAPRHVLANNFGLPEDRAPNFVKQTLLVAAGR